MKYFFILLIPFIFLIMALIYLFPFLQGLILLPLDLLVSKYTPWYVPGTILLKNPYMQDSIVQLFPWKHLVFQALTRGIIPFWNPYQFLGLPFMANVKTMVFYPLNILFIFNEVKAWNFLLFLQIFLGMLFAYYLARDLNLKKLQSIFVGLAFGLNSYMIGLLEFGSDAHTIIWWPLILLFSKKYLDYQKGRYLFALSIFLAFSILGGQLQYLAYFMILLLAFIIYYGIHLKAKLLTYNLLFISIVLGFGICALQLFPSIELFKYSHRGLLPQEKVHEVFSRGLVSPNKLFRLFSPDFFGNPVNGDMQIGYIETSGYFGIIPLFFALFSFFYLKKNVLVRFFGLTFVISLLMCLKGIGELFYILKIPIITSGSGDRIFTIVLFSGAILSGFGLSQFVEIKDSKKKIISVILFLILFILAIFISRKSIALSEIKFTLIIFSIFTFVCIVQRKIVIKIFLLFAIGITFFDLFRMGYRFLTFSNKKFLYSELEVTKFVRRVSKESLGRTFGFIEPELGTYLNIYSVETYNPLYLQRTSTLMQALQKMSFSTVSTDNKYFLNSVGDNLKHTLDFLGVENIVVSNDENPSIKYFKTDKFESDLQKIYSGNRYSIYKNISSYPRYGLYYKDKVIKNELDMLNAIKNETVDFRETVLLSENLPLILEKGTGFVKFISSDINTQKFRIFTTKPALFYISDAYYPGWTAKINNKPAKIYQANYNLRAVLVPKGNFLVEFAYIPDGFFIGIITSIVSFLALNILVFTKFKKLKKIIT